jgi:hypothetical protein
LKSIDYLLDFRCIGFIGEFGHCGVSPVDFSVPPIEITYLEKRLYISVVEDILGMGTLG